MNFLAHAFLSGNDPDILFGNFVADSIKGSMIERYTPEVKQGVILHRAIDDFTDHHPVVRKSIERLQPAFRKYSGVVTDIYFDHFLAKYWSEYTDQDLSAFATRVYKLLIVRYASLPPRSKRILPWMIAQNWLVGYANLNDLQRVFNGMSRRARFDSGMDHAVGFLKIHYGEFLDDFRMFFPELMQEFQNGSKTEKDNETPISSLII